jgi:RNA polymerase sigma factor (sigma-70 family)
VGSPAEGTNRAYTCPSDEISRNQLRRVATPRRSEVACGTLSFKNIWQGDLGNPRRRAGDMPVVNNVSEPDDVKDPGGDARLLFASRRGDERAFAELFDRHSKRIYSYCFRRSGDWMAAEDLTSATFLTAWRRRSDAVLIDESMLPWLYGIATNLARRNVRSVARRSALQSRLPRAQVDEEDLADSVAQRVDDSRRLREVVSVLGRLPRRERDVVILFAWEGLTYEQIALAIDTPIGTVRSRLARARSHLSSLMGELTPQAGDIEDMGDHADIRESEDR